MMVAVQQKSFLLKAYLLDWGEKTLVMKHSLHLLKKNFKMQKRLFFLFKKSLSELPHVCAFM